MAIAIDLLPGYVGKEKLFKRLLAGALLLLVVVGGVLYSIYYKNQQLLHKYTEEADLLQPFATQAQTVQQAADKVVGETAPMQAAVSFMADASKTGPQRAALLNLVTKYIYYKDGHGAVISLLDISDGATVTMNATMDTPEDYNRFLTTLRSGSALRTPPGPLFADNPTASGIPGFPPPPPNASNNGGTGGGSSGGYPGSSGGGGQQIAHAPGEPYVKLFPLTVQAKGTLKNKVTLPPDPVGGGAPAGGGSSSGYPGGSSSGSGS